MQLAGALTTAAECICLKYTARLMQARMRRQGQPISIEGIPRCRFFFIHVACACASTSAHLRFRTSSSDTSRWAARADKPAKCGARLVSAASMLVCRYTSFMRPRLRWAVRRSTATIRLPGSTFWSHEPAAWLTSAEEQPHPCPEQPGLTEMHQISEARQGAKVHEAMKGQPSRCTNALRGIAPASYTGQRLL